VGSGFFFLFFWKVDGPPMRMVPIAAMSRHFQFFSDKHLLSPAHPPLFFLCRGEILRAGRISELCVAFIATQPPTFVTRRFLSVVWIRAAHVRLLGVLIPPVIFVHNLTTFPTFLAPSPNPVIKIQRFPFSMPCPPTQQVTARVTPSLLPNLRLLPGRDNAFYSPPNDFSPFQKSEGFFSIHSSATERQLPALFENSQFPITGFQPTLL